MCIPSNHAKSPIHDRKRQPFVRFNFIFFTCEHAKQHVSEDLPHDGHNTAEHIELGDRLVAAAVVAAVAVADD